MELPGCYSHLNTGKQDWPMPTHPAPCILKNNYFHTQIPSSWIFQDCGTRTNSSFLTPQGMTLRALQDLEWLLIAIPHKQHHQPLCPCLLHKNYKWLCAGKPHSGSRSGNESSREWGVLGPGISRAVSW